jgi:hypothetical protein
MKVLSMLAVAVAVLAAGCGSKPQAPDWQVGARGSLDRYEAAYLAGDGRAADAEFARARQQLSSTGQAALVARAELTRCALQVASLVFDRCTGFEPLRPDAGDAERAYAAYLQGEPVAADQLPAQHRAVAGPAAPMPRPCRDAGSAGAAGGGGRGDAIRAAPRPRCCRWRSTRPRSKDGGAPWPPGSAPSCAWPSRPAPPSEAERLRRRLALVDGGR